MAVYTNLADPRYSVHLSQIGEAYGFSLSQIDGIALGSSNSSFKITIHGTDTPFVLTIYEPPEVTPEGLSNEAYQISLRYHEYLSGALDGAVDKYGNPVRVRVPRPLRARSSARKLVPFLELSFDGVMKVISIMPFIQGTSYENSPHELVDAKAAYAAGKALAAYLNISRSYPDSGLFPRFDFTNYTRQITLLRKNRLVLERLGFVLSDCLLDGSKAKQIGRDYLDEMISASRQLLDDWHHISIRQPAFASTLLHSDLFNDNAIIDEKGQLYMLDFSETSFGPSGIDIGIALTSWASLNGAPIPVNILSLLQGFDQVSTLTSEQLAQIPLFTKIGAFRWETYRVQRLEMHDPRHISVRSPAELRQVRQGWRALQGLFNQLQSVDELVFLTDFGDSDNETGRKV